MHREVCILGAETFGSAREHALDRFRVSSMYESATTSRQC